MHEWYLILNIGEFSHQPSLPSVSGNEQVWRPSSSNIVRSCELDETSVQYIERLRPVLELFCDPLSRAFLFSFFVQSCSVLIYVQHTHRKSFELYVS